MASTASSVSASPVQGIPGTTVDPWSIQPRERARYEEQFKALRPSNGIVTGDQAKGFMLQSQLPPLVLGQIWSLSDTDADGKMDINEFSIACKLINLKLRGFEIPKALPASLISSVKNTHVPPTIPPLPGQLLNMNIQNTSTVPVRPHPPKPSPPLITNTPLITTQMQSQPLISNLIGQASTTNMTPLSQTNNSNLIQPLASNTNNSAPLIPNVQQNLVQQSTVPNLSQNMPVISQPLPQSQPIPVPGISSSVSGLIQPLGSNMPSNIQNIIPSLSQVIPGSIVYTSPVVPTSTPGSGGPPVISSATGTPQSRSIDRIASLDSPAQLEWSVPHQTKLKFTQLFNTTDRTRTGYLSGVQARNLMLQSKLPQSILAQIWALSDMDSDGRLGCDEFVLAMHLCEQATMGKLPPAVLPPDMVPPAFRRGSITSSAGIPITGMSRHGSISSQGSQPTEMDPAASLLQTTFEDKRKENFEKGQAELERRRRALLEAQRAEAEARERKEREEQERRERAKAEQEKRRQQELQQQLQEQLEKERQLEEERKRQQEQRDAARREMERQRQLEWEKQRSQELQQQRQRAQENVLRLKARNQSLTIELNTLTDQVKELSQKICDTRVGVSNVKTTIDGMRVTRDTHMQELSQLKNKLKDQNARLIALSQEKAKLDTKNKINSQLNDQFLEQTQAAYDNKEVAIKNLKEKLSDMEKQIHGKMNDIENNNSQLTELTNQLTDLVSECENLYCAYEEKKNKVLEMKGLNRTSSLDYTSGWKDDSAWDTATTNDWSVENTTVNDNSSNVAGMIRYRALYEFVARNQDEISFQPGDIILVPQEQNGEPGWLAGEIRGHVGWFPQSYVEQMDTVASESQATDSTLTSTVDSSLSTAFDDGFAVSKTLEGIAEVPETLSENSHSADTVIAGDISAPTVLSESESEPEFYVACYAYQSIEQGDLSFNAGDLITVVKKDGDWWTGKIGENIGIFPSNYVQKSETNGTVTNGIDNTNNLPASVPEIKPIEEVKQDNVQSSNDAEISAIIEKRHSKVLEKSPDFAAMASNTQTMKSSKKPEIASVIAPYQATSPEQLTLARGQLIMIRKKSESGWWEGELQAKGRRRQVGWFPATYVKILESSGRNSGRNTPVSASKTDQQEMILDKVIALFPYTAQNADELTFAKDDIISVTGRDEQAWWRGELNGVSGLFPSNYVGPLQLNAKKRQEYILELISSEKSYIEDMTIVHEVFEKPLLESGVLSEELIKKIFINWEDILGCNYNFLKDLILRRDESDAGIEIIGDIICDHIPQMIPYIHFCMSQLEAASLLQSLTETSPNFLNLVKKCQSDPKTKGMPLSSFLIKPMQRITKYPLIISKILENTHSNKEDYIYLKEALDLSEKFCKQINEVVRQTENTERLEWLQKYVNLEGISIIFNSETNLVGPRKLLHHGLITKMKSNKELLGFLMNDFLLLTLFSKPLSTTQQFNFEKNFDVELKIYKQPIFVNEISISKTTKSSLENIDSDDSCRSLTLVTPYKTFTFLTSTVNECMLWIKRITDAKLLFEKQYNKIQVKNKLPSISQGRLFVNVIRGAHFQRISGKNVCENVFCKFILSGQEQLTNTTNAVLNQMSSIQQSVLNSSPLEYATFDWNTTMQFHVYNLKTDVLKLSIFEKCFYSPNQFLGSAEIKLSDLSNETKTSPGPLTKKIKLMKVESGEILLKLDLNIFERL